MKYIAIKDFDSTQSWNGSKWEKRKGASIKKGDILYSQKRYKDKNGHLDTRYQTKWNERGLFVVSKTYIYAHPELFKKV